MTTRYLAKQTRYFHDLFRVYQKHGGKKDIQAFDNSQWEPFGSRHYINYKIRQVILDYPIVVNKKLEQERLILLHSQSHLIHTLSKYDDIADRQQEPILLLTYENDILSDQIYDIEQQLYLLKENHMNSVITAEQTELNMRLKLKLDFIVQKERETIMNDTQEQYRHDNRIHYEIRDALQKIVCILEKI